MVRADVVTLIAETPGAHGVYETPQYTRRTVYAEIRSVGMTEAYQARATGLNPEMKLRLSHSCEYKGEKLCELRGTGYRIIRTWMDEGDGIELTLERISGNANACAEEPAETEDESTDTTPDQTEGNEDVQ